MKTAQQMKMYLTLPDDEEFIFVPFICQITSKQNESIRMMKLGDMSPERHRRV